MTSPESFWPCRILFDMEPQILRRQGPMIPASMRSLRSDPGPIVAGFVILDTGSSGMLIDESVAEELQLPVQKEHDVHGAHGWAKSKKYSVELWLPVTAAASPDTRLAIAIGCTGIPGLRAKNEKDGVVVLGMLGRDFFQFCNLSINGHTGKIEIVIDEAIQWPAPA
jgi:aspartyl protease